jgi:acetyl-CoA carboxylase carboxyltransferase component
VTPDVAAAAQEVRELLGYLPQTIGTPPPAAAGWRAPQELDLEHVVPLEPRRAYDVRAVLSAVCDADSVRELHPRWARNVVTALGRIEGRPVALVANQPRHLGGVLDAAGSEKAAWFVGWADRFGLPVVAFVDTPGFMPGSRQERAGVIRHGASLVRAFAAARVPKLTVVLRKAYGGAYITMNSRDLGSDLVLAWPGAELGIMNARTAVGIVERRQLRVAVDPEAERDRLAAAYAAQHLGADAAAASGHVDEIIPPAETRPRLAAGLGALAGTPTSR